MQSYRDASWHLLGQAYNELRDGDTRQASEKGWGAAAQIVNAVAAQRGWEHRGHRQLHAVVNSLRQETGNPDVRRLFDVAGFLHSNYYEDWVEPESISESLTDVERFMGLLEDLL